GVIRVGRGRACRGRAAADEPSGALQAKRQRSPPSPSGGPLPGSARGQGGVLRSAPMSRALSLLMIAASLALAPACVNKNAEPEWLKLPPGYNPVDSDLTFNQSNLEKCNSMSPKEREAHLEGLKGAPGTFKGQALMQSGQGLGETVEDSQHGEYEVMATVPDPVRF